MNGLQLMVEEHVYIKRMLKVIRQACQLILEDKPVDYGDFALMIDFVREYADKHHHGKEEDILFNRIIEETGETGEKLITHGMMVEHLQGRLFIHDLEQAVEAVQKGNHDARLDVIANAISYTHLLNRHIDKEDDVVYPFADRKLKSETLEQIHGECAIFEGKQMTDRIQEKYVRLVSELEAKYGL